MLIHQDKASVSTEVSIDEIGRKIHILRGHKVILDTYLSNLYQVETKSLKRSVKRNITRFPSDFMFELTKEETSNLKSEFDTSKTIHQDNRGGNRYYPFAFTEPGVAMLSTILNSERALQVNIVLLLEHSFSFAKRPRLI